MTKNRWGVAMFGCTLMAVGGLAYFAARPHPQSNYDHEEVLRKDARVRTSYLLNSSQQAVADLRSHVAFLEGNYTAIKHDLDVDLLLYRAYGRLALIHLHSLDEDAAVQAFENSFRCFLRRLGPHLNTQKSIDEGFPRRFGFVDYVLTNSLAADQGQTPAWSGDAGLSTNILNSVRERLQRKMIR